MKTKYKFLALASISLLAVGIFASTPALAQNTDNVLQGVNATGGNAGSATVDTVVKQVINVLSWVVGIIAVIMIIISGLRFITSNGDPSKISSARNGIIYALVGIVIVAMAQVIVRYVLTLIA